MEATTRTSHIFFQWLDTMTGCYNRWCATPTLVSRIDCFNPNRWTCYAHQSFCSLGISQRFRVSRCCADSLEKLNDRIKASFPWTVKCPHSLPTSHLRATRLRRVQLITCQNENPGISRKSSKCDVWRQGHIGFHYRKEFYSEICNPEAKKLCFNFRNFIA